MKLYPPVKQAKYWGWQHTLKNLEDFKKCLTQRFGESPNDYKPFLGHTGIDVPYKEGTQVLACHDGSIQNFEEKKPDGTYSGYGKYVVVSNKELGVKTIYAHLNDFAFPTGYYVKAGQIIGYGGSTGRSTGPHLHLTLKLIDVNGEVKDRNNGFDGAVDPLPYLVWFDMSETLVKARQVCEGYLDPEGQKFWANKQEVDYWIKRLEDKIKQEQEVLEELKSVYGK